MKNSIILFFFILLMAPMGRAQSDIVFHPSHEAKKQNAPFSDAVEAGGFLFLAGQIGMDHGTRTLIKGGIVAETEQTIANIKAVLKQHGLGLDDVVKCMVVLADMDDFSTFNGVYTQHFTKKPARTTFAAKGLARNARIEIEVVAYKGDR
ncbi:Rid family detoxifying hydrolase [Sediminicola luteus]|uniref:Reactive intermediate/imine deaminase n=1 Tax=Sediminicola luteus TaxID=319238 RepID=A0A2A4G881_9FLAO|nr:Rid family detoxifying hydrolase [Sediminicola luteus]PCE64631.1 reactive intermediate/imine deaminase [Sediminicola luteus]